MRTYTRREAASAVVAMALLPTAARAADPSAPRRGGTLHMAVNAVPPSASIQEETVIVALQPFMPVFNNLVMFDQGKDRDAPDTIVPDLASAWRWSDDGTLLRFDLRRGVKWHDGAPFTSADVKATWDTILRRRKAGWRRIPRSGQFTNLAEVVTDGDLSVAFRLRRPQPSFLTLLATGFSAVYPAHVDGATMRRRPVGTGPFRVATFTSDSIKLVRNPDYWKAGRPYLDAIETTVITSPSTLSLAFASGALDIANVVAPSLAEMKAQMPSVSYRVGLINAHFQLLLNRHRPPFDDPRVRQAVDLTLDRQEFVASAGLGLGKVGGAMLPQPEGVWGLSPEDLAGLPGYGPDVAARRVAAQGLMRSAGHDPEAPLRLPLIARNLPTFQLPSIILIDQLRKIGIEADLQLIETAQFSNVQRGADWPMLLSSYGAASDDPDIVLFDNYACGSPANYSKYCSPEMQARIEAQSATLDSVERRRLVQEIDRLLQEDVAGPVLMHIPMCYCQQPRVRGFVPAENTIYSHWRMEDVWLDA